MTMKNEEFEEELPEKVKKTLKGKYILEGVFTEFNKTTSHDYRNHFYSEELFLKHVKELEERIKKEKEDGTHKTI